MKKKYNKIHSKWKKRINNKIYKFFVKNSLIMNKELHPNDCIEDEDIIYYNYMNLNCYLKFKFLKPYNNEKIRFIAKDINSTYKNYTIINPIFL